MRFIAATLIATFGLSACREPARHALGPIGDPNGRDGTLMTADTVIDYKVAPWAAAPTLVSGVALRLPKISGPYTRIGSVAMSFVIDTSGFVIRSSVRIETPSAGEHGDAFRDWLLAARFEPVRRGGRPVRAAFRNLVAWFPLTR
jgi:hypothetical protein